MVTATVANHRPIARPPSSRCPCTAGSMAAAITIGNCKGVFGASGLPKQQTSPSASSSLRTSLARSAGMSHGRMSQRSARPSASAASIPASGPEPAWGVRSGMCARPGMAWSGPETTTSPQHASAIVSMVSPMARPPSRACCLGAPMRVLLPPARTTAAVRRLVTSGGYRLRRREGLAGRQTTQGSPSEQPRRGVSCWTRLEVIEAAVEAYASLEPHPPGMEWARSDVGMYRLGSCWCQRLQGGIDGCWPPLRAGRTESEKQVGAAALAWRGPHVQRRPTSDSRPLP